MAKKWCGFSVQNELIKHDWNQLVQMQDEIPETITLEAYDAEPAGEPESEEPVPIPIGNNND